MNKHNEVLNMYTKSYNLNMNKMFTVKETDIKAIFVNHFALANKPLLQNPLIQKQKN